MPRRVSVRWRLTVSAAEVLERDTLRERGPTVRLTRSSGSHVLRDGRSARHDICELPSALHTRSIGRGDSPIARIDLGTAREPRNVVSHAIGGSSITAVLPKSQAQPSLT